MAKIEVGKFEAGNTKEEGYWGVFDTLARQVDDKTQDVMPRAHEARPGRTYKLRNDVPCWMPETDARVFLVHPAFVVWNDNEELVPALNAQALERKQPTVMAANLVIADLNELTSDALLTRAAQKHSGNRFTSETRREALIRFLLDGNIEHQRTAAPKRQIEAPEPAGAGDVEEMPEGSDDVARILEGA